VLPVRARSGVAVVKKAPLPIPPPRAVPTISDIAVPPLASPLLPPWSRLLLSVLLPTATEPPSFQTPPPPATPRSVAVMPPGIVATIPTEPPSAATAWLPLKVLESMVTVPASL
jgi:hypothetical protein